MCSCQACWNQHHLTSQHNHSPDRSTRISIQTHGIYVHSRAAVMIWSKTWSRLIGQPSMCDSQPSLAVYEGQAVGRWIDTSGGVKHWYGVGKLNVVSSLGRCLSGNVQQTEKWTVEFMTTTFFEPVRPAYDSATGRVHLNFSLQPAEQVHIVLLVDVSGFSTHIQVTKLGPMANPGPRPYTRLSSSQNKALMDHCIDEPYPNHSTAFNLSQRLDIPREQTMKWFQRARAQNRQRTPMHLLNETGGAHPVKKQTASTELRSPYMLRSKSKKVRWAQNPPEMESVTVSASIDAVIEKAWDGEDTIIADHPGSTMGMTLVKENSRVVRRSARVGGV